MEVVEIELSKLKESDYNPRFMNQDEMNNLEDSIKAFGFVEPVVVNPDYQIIGGHQRFYACRTLGYKSIPCVIIDLGDKNKEKLLNVALNKIHGNWDIPKLYSLIEGLRVEDVDISLSGFDTDELNKLFKDLPGVKDKEQEDEELTGKLLDNLSEPIVKTGDVWQLGNHRLMCGDATKKEDVEKLMNGKKVDMVFTDPPYNIKHDYNSYDDNVSDEEYGEFCLKWFENLQELTDNIIITCGTKNLPMWCQIDIPLGIACWIKKNWTTSCKISDLQQWEPILFYGKFGRNRTSDLFEYNRIYQKDVENNHTCPKQLSLIIDIISHYSKINSNCLDIFGGSGTTLIACEQTGRICYMLEIDPVYCDVIIKRWEGFTNKKAVKL